MTYSLVAYDRTTAQWGVATQSKFLAVGSVVPWAQAGVGAVATQSYANPAYGPDGLALLAAGHTAAEVVAALTSADAGRDHRQLGIVDAQGDQLLADALAHAAIMPVSFARITIREEGPIRKHHFAKE